MSYIQDLVLLSTLNHRIQEVYEEEMEFWRNLRSTLNEHNPKILSGDEKKAIIVGEAHFHDLDSHLEVLAPYPVVVYNENDLDSYIRENISRWEKDIETYALNGYLSILNFINKHYGSLIDFARKHKKSEGEAMGPLVKSGLLGLLISTYVYNPLGLFSRDLGYYMAIKELSDKAWEEGKVPVFVVGRAHVYYPGFLKKLLDSENFPAVYFVQTNIGRLYHYDEMGPPDKRKEGFEKLVIYKPQLWGLIGVDKDNIEDFVNIINYVIERGLFKKEVQKSIGYEEDNGLSRIIDSIDDVFIREKLDMNSSRHLKDIYRLIEESKGLSLEEKLIAFESFYETLLSSLVNNLSDSSDFDDFEYLYDDFYFERMMRRRMRRRTRQETLVLREIQDFLDETKISKEAREKIAKKLKNEILSSLPHEHRILYVISEESKSINMYITGTVAFSALSITNPELANEVEENLRRRHSR